MSLRQIAWRGASYQNFRNEVSAARRNLEMPAAGREALARESGGSLNRLVFHPRRLSDFNEGSARIVKRPSAGLTGGEGKSPWVRDGTAGASKLQVGDKVRDIVAFEVNAVLDAGLKCDRKVTIQKQLDTIAAVG